MSFFSTIAGRRSLTILAGLVAGVLSVLAISYACTNVAVISLDRVRARPGRTVQGTGQYFRAAERDAGIVEIHFNDLKGNVVAETTVDSTQTPAGARCCNITFDFAVPNVPPGYYTIIATQYRLSTGEPVYGTPARTSLKVRPAR